MLEIRCVRSRLWHRIRARSGHAAAILVAALAWTWLPAGCAPDRAFAFRSQRVGEAAPVRWLQVDALIATADPANPVKHVMNDAFQASLVLRLALCNVRAKVLSSPADFEHPDAGTTHTLTIRIADKQVTETRIVNRYYMPLETIYSGTLYFGLELEDTRSHASVWTAQSSFEFATAEFDEGTQESLGSDFARGIVTQLQHDGLLPGCLHEEHPGCLADWREGLQRAARIPDRLRRADAVNRVHTCRWSRSTPH